MRNLSMKLKDADSAKKNVKIRVSKHIMQNQGVT